MGKFLSNLFFIHSLEKSRLEVRTLLKNLFFGGRGNDFTHTFTFQPCYLITLRWRLHTYLWLHQIELNPRSLRLVRQDVPDFTGQLRVNIQNYPELDSLFKWQNSPWYIYGRTYLDGYLIKNLGIFSPLYVHIGDYSTTFEVF